MKKTVLTTLIILIASTLWAYTDSYQFLKEETAYNSLVHSIRVENNTERAEKLFDEIYNVKAEDEQELVTQAKASIVYARYIIMESNGIPKERALQILDETERRIKKMDKKSFYYLTLMADIESIRFLSNRSDLSAGIASSKMIKKAYKHYPEESYAIMLKANTMIFAPGFAGGDKKGALSMMSSLYTEFANQLSKWDYASLLSAIGIACYELSEFTYAEGYLAVAKSICAIDSELDAYIAKTEEELT